MRKVYMYPTAAPVSSGSQGFEITHEAISNLADAYDVVVSPGNQIVPATYYGLADSWHGVRVYNTDTNVKYGQKNLSTPSTTGHCRGRVYVKQDTLGISTDGYFMFTSIFNSSGSDLGFVRWGELSGSICMQVGLVDDGSNYFFTAFYPIANVAHYVEWDLERASGSGASDGYMTLWVDGVQKEKKQGIDNYDRMSNWSYIQFGVPRYRIGTITGAFLFDEIVVNDTGSAIGPCTQYPPAYYVDTVNGDDAHDGLSPEAAWQTLTKVNGFDFTPGVSCRFKAGQAFVGHLQPTCSGVSGSYVRFDRFHDNGSEPVINGSGGGYAFWVTNSYNYLQFQNLDFSGATGSTPTARYNSNYGYFESCIFRDAAAYHGFVAYSTGGSDIHHINMQSCTFRNNYKSGLYVGGSTGVGGPHDVLIAGCTSHDNGNDIYSDHGFYIDFDVHMLNCIAYNNSSAGFKTNDNGYDSALGGPEIDRCESYSNADGIFCGGKYTIIHDCLIHDNHEYNLRLSTAADHTEVYFNTFVNMIHASTSYGAIAVNMGTIHGCIIKNNIIVQDQAVVQARCIWLKDGTMDVSGSANTWDYNTYYYNGSAAGQFLYEQGDASYHTFAQWQASAGSPDAHSTYLLELPDFVTRYTDLHVAGSGNLKGLGQYMSAYAQDRDYADRPSPPTPGCYETSG